MRYSYLLLFFLFACKENIYNPMPYGYLRLDLPEATYQMYDTVQKPYRFAFSSSAKIIDKPSKKAVLQDIYYPNFQASVYLTYHKVENEAELEKLTEHAYKLVYDHASQAKSIVQEPIDVPAHKVYGILYLLKGSVASYMQFYVTDSNKNFMRGALYFNAHTQWDSLQPVVKFLEKDTKKMLETLEWR